MVVRWLLSIALGSATAGLLSLSLSGCSVSSPSAAEDTEAVQVRVINFSPNSSALSLVLQDNVIGGFLPFKQASPYISVTPGQYDIGFLSRSRSASETGKLLGSYFADLTTGGKFSILAINEASQVTPIILDNNQSPRFDRAMVRFVQAIPDSSEPLDLVTHLGKTVVAGLTFGQVSEYVALEPGFITLAFQKSTASIPGTSSLPVLPLVQKPLGSLDTKLDAAKVYTVYATGLWRGNPGPELVIVEEDTDI
jgi:hypothetical protein